MFDLSLAVNASTRRRGSIGGSSSPFESLQRKTASDIDRLRSDLFARLADVASREQQRLWSAVDSSPGATQQSRTSYAQLAKNVSLARAICSISIS
jgi:hypothetical protein